MKKSPLVLLSLLLVITACTGPERFDQAFDPPAWFDAVEAPRVHSAREVSALWQSAKRCCVDEATLLRNNRIFYKSCFNAISEHYDDESLVVKCLWLMGVSEEPEHRAALSRFLLDNFAHHRDDIRYCANCMPGDTVARVALGLARHERQVGSGSGLPIERIESLLDERRDEISYWVQAEIYAFLGKLYLEDGINDERFERFSAAYERLNEARQDNQPLAKRFARVEERYRRMSQLRQSR